MHIDPAFLHWWYAAFFAIFGIIAVGPARNALNPRSAWAGLRVAAGDGSSDDERIEAAVARRQQAEGPPTPVGLYVGGVCFVLAIVQAAGIVQFTLLYAVLCLSMAGFAVVAFSRLRNLQSTRAAVLAVRKSGAVIPPYWFIALAVSGMLLMIFAGVAYELAGIAVGVSTLVTTYIAWRMTLLPAMLSGTDLPAEQIVDDRLRFNRSTACIFYAIAQTFVFWCQIGNLDAWQMAGAALSTLLLFGFLVWTTAWRYRAVRLA